MPEFTIYSIGDSAFLEQILIAVAMITGTRDFTAMVSVGLLIGIIMITVQSVFQGAKQINFQQILIGWLLYAMFFIPQTIVKIEDAYTGEVRPVANVPIGIGFAGGVISNIGYTITKLFETGYGVIVPNVTETHFSETLQILNDTRRRAYDSSVFTGLNQEIGGGFVDVRRSVTNYIKECTLTKIDLGLMKLDDLLNLPLDQALKFDSSIYGTKVYLNPTNSQGSDFNCTEAWSSAEGIGIIGALNNLTGTRVTTALNHILNVDTTTGTNSITKISDALQAVGATSTSATDYLKVSLLEPLYYEAAAGKYQDLQDFGSALAINQAIQQRNTQWAAQQTLFMTTVRPFLTFFEGFIYAITPIMGFIIVLGSMGVTLTGKYFQTVIWIQLWMPVLSVTNLFIHTSATNQMSSYTNSGLNSIYALTSSSDVLQTWISTGGMLAAATPIISLFIVTGSTYAFTSLANKLSGSDHFNEKTTNPDSLQNGPVVQSQPENTFNHLTGLSKTGAGDLMGQLSFGSGLTKTTASAHQRQEQAQSSFSEALGSSFTSGQMNESTYSKLASLGRTHSAAHGTTKGLVNERARSIMESTGISQDHSDAVKGIVSAVASGSISGDVGTGMIAQMAEQYSASESKSADAGGKSSNVQHSKSVDASKNAKKGINAGLDGSVKVAGNKETTDTKKSSQSEKSDWSDALKFTDQQSSTVTNNLAHAITNSTGENFKESFGANIGKELKQSAQKVSSASNTFSTASQLQNQFGSMSNMQIRNLASTVAGNNNGAMSSLNDYWNSGAVNQNVKDEAKGLTQLYKGYNLSEEQSVAAARLTAMTNAANFQGENYNGFNSSVKAAAGVIGKSLGRNILTEGEYSQNSNLKNVNQDQTESNVREANQGADSKLSPAASLVQPNSDGFPELSSPTNGTQPSVIDSEANRNQSNLSGDAIQKETQRNKEAESSAWQTLKNHGPEYSRLGAAELYGGVENAGDWTTRRLQQAENLATSGGQAISEGASTANQAFADKLQKLQNTPELRQQVIQSAKQDDEKLEKSGFGGSILSGLSSAGRMVMGAAATAMELVDGNMNFSDLKDVSIEEKGMIYQAALSHAMSEGGEAAVAKFNENFEGDFKHDFYEHAMSSGLTHEQAMVYKESFDQSITNSDNRQAAIDALTATYTETDQSGNSFISEQNQEKVDYLVNTITESARAGKDLSGSYLSGIAHYNSQTGRTSKLN